MGRVAGSLLGSVDCWREMTDISASTWLDRMENDDVVWDLIQSKKIPFKLGDKRIEQAKSDLFQILPRMAEASMDDPMNRTACDDVIHGVCPWQYYCWSPVEVELDDLNHLYKTKS